MRRALGWALACGLLSAVAPGCGTTRGTADVLAEKPSADAREYRIDTDAAWRLAARTFELAGFEGITEHRDQSSITAERTVSGGASATVAAAWIEAARDGMTRVSFATIRQSAVAPRSPTADDELHVRFAGLVSLEGR
jgi:hypothetical protein